MAKKSKPGDGSFGRGIKGGSIGLSDLNSVEDVKNEVHPDGSLQEPSTSAKLTSTNDKA